MICRTRKGTAHKDGVLFINAVGEVTRKNAQSYLEPSHIEKIVQVYENASAIDGFSQFASLEEIAKNRYSLSIARYTHEQETNISQQTINFDDSLNDWLESAENARSSYSNLIKMLEAQA